MSDEPTTDLPGSSRDVTRDIPAAPESGPPCLPEVSIASGTSASSHKIEPPKLDGYDVVCAIGEGGMGTVWRAVQLSTRRDVALKLMSAAAFGSERAKQRFDREVEITAKLEHPNIARIYDSGINRGVYFYAMELIDGLPLDTFVERQKLSRRQILQLFALVCRGVQHAHERGVIHRDLKPGNILVSPDGQPHVLDFGLAKALLAAGKDAGISIDGEVAGTPGFMAPEQAAGKIDLDARCDVYSLGVILYRLLTDAMPHDLSGTYLDVLRRVSEEEPKRARDADRTLDDELDTVLMHAIARDPALRYKTAGEFAQDIENYLNDEPILARVPSSIYILRKRIHKHRVVLMIAGVLAVLVAAAATLTVRLVHSHHAAVTASDEKNISEVKALEENRNRQLADRNKEIAIAGQLLDDGDKAISAGKFGAALSAYLDARRNLNLAGAPTFSADVAIWDLDRLAPSPLNFIAKPAANALVTASPVIMTDRRHALAGYDDGNVRVYDLATGQTTQTIAAGKTPIRSIAISGDGKVLAIGGEAGSLEVFDLPSGQLKAELSSAHGPLLNRVTRLALSADGRRLLSVSGMTPAALESADYNDMLTLWDLSSKKLLRATDRAAGVLAVNKTVTHAEFSADGSRLLTASGTVDVWNTIDGTRIGGLPISATAATFAPQATAFIAGTSDGTIHIYDLPTQKHVTSPGHGSAILSVGFNEARGEVVALDETGAMRAITPQGIDLWSLPARGDVDSGALSDDATLAITSSDQGVSIWRAEPSLQARQLDGGPFPACSLSRDGRLAVAQRSRRGFSAAGNGVLFDASVGKPLQIPALSLNICDAAAISRDGLHLAVFSGSALAVWSLQTLTEVHRFTVNHTGTSLAVAVMAISADGSKVALAPDDRSLLIYRVEPTARLLAAIINKAPITSLAFSANGQLLLTGSEDTSVEILNADTVSSIATLSGHGAPVNAVAFSAAGDIAVTVSGAAPFSPLQDNSIRVWSVPAGKLLATLGDQGASRYRSVGISDDGRYVAAGADDQTISIFDRTTKQLLRTVHDRHGPVLSLAFDSTASRLLVGDDKLTFFDFTSPETATLLEHSLSAAQSAVLSPQYFLALARWYAFRGEWPWAGDLFDDALKGGAAPSALERLYCDWSLDRFDAARADLAKIPAQDLPPTCVKLYEATLKARPPGK